MGLFNTGNTSTVGADVIKDRGGSRSGAFRILFHILGFMLMPVGFLSWMLTRIAGAAKGGRVLASSLILVSLVAGVIGVSVQTFVLNLPISTLPALLEAPYGYLFSCLTDSVVFNTTDFAKLYLYSLGYTIPIGMLVGSFGSMFNQKKSMGIEDVEWRAGISQVLTKTLNRKALKSGKRSGKGVDLGVDQDGKMATIPARSIGMNGLILGGTGTGKSTTILVAAEQIAAAGNSIIAIDMKNSWGMAKGMSDIAEKYDIPFYHFASQNINLPYPGPAETPSFWVPFDGLDYTAIHDVIVAMNPGTGGVDQHYRDQENQWIDHMIPIIGAWSKRNNVPFGEIDWLGEVKACCNLGTIVERATLMQDDSGLTLEQREHIEQVILMAGETNRERAENIRTLNTIRTTINKITGNAVTSPWVRPAPIGSGYPEIRLVDILKSDSPSIVLFSVDTQSYGDTGPTLSRMLINVIRATAGKTQADRKNRYTQLIVDEFTASEDKNIVKMLFMFREAGIPVLLATQALANIRELDKNAETSVDQVASNTDYKIIHKVVAPSEAQYISDMTGLVKRQKFSQEVAYRSNFTGDDVSSGIGRGRSEMEEDNLIRPSQLSGLKRGQAVLLCPDENGENVPARIVDIVSVNPDQTQEKPHEGETSEAYTKLVALLNYEGGIVDEEPEEEPAEEYAVVSQPAPEPATPQVSVPRVGTLFGGPVVIGVDMSSEQYRDEEEPEDTPVATGGYDVPTWGEEEPPEPAFVPRKLKPLPNLNKTSVW